MVHFQEKPAAGTALATTVNTGTYLIEQEALAAIVPGERAMWETDIFPAMIGAGAAVFGFEAPHRWLDVGTPAGYFAAQSAIFADAVWNPPGKEADGIWLEGAVELASAAEAVRPIAIGGGTRVAGAMLRGPLSIGRACRIGADAWIERSAIWSGCIVDEGATVVDSIIGYNCRIGPDASIEGALLGDGVVVGRGARIEIGSRIASGTIVAPYSVERWPLERK